MTRRIFIFLVADLAAGPLAMLGRLQQCEDAFN
jgi:hypothetical protein